MNLYSQNTALANTSSSPLQDADCAARRRQSLDIDCFRKASLAAEAARLAFSPVTPDDMDLIWSYLRRETGRTTDFSYGGVLMWVDFFQYEYAIARDTLFIKGKVEGDLSKTAFSMPVGDMPLDEAVTIIREYCINNEIQCIFSAVPQYRLEEFLALDPATVEEIPDWADYLYSAESLATLSGKKYGKKRNHVNQFLAAYPEWSLEPLTAENAPEALAFMDAIDSEGDRIEMAIKERQLNRKTLKQIVAGDKIYKGVILRGGGQMLGFTIGDVKGDTLFIHIEKALREAPGAFEMINKEFAAAMLAENPAIRYINREDDAGDIGLRLAKESYHPVEMLAKYNIRF